MSEHWRKLLRIFVILGVCFLLISSWSIGVPRGYASESPQREAPTVAEAPSGETAQSLGAQPELPIRIEPSLLRRLLEGAPDDQHRFIIELKQQANLGSLADGLPRLDRRAQIVHQLKALASQTQFELLSFLQAQRAGGQVQEVHPFWIFNGVAVTADASTLLALAARPEVRIIREDSWRQWVEPTVVEEDQTPPDAHEVEWNISRIRADLAWSALGLDGKGVTVAIMDTGVDWQHPALLEQYRGFKPGGLSIHQGNWYCTTDEGYLYPVDGHGHGTHMAGIAVGRDETGPAIGVAPGARWIAVKTLNDAGYGYDSWIHAAFEWLMAPAGDPSLAPDIVNGSWSSAYGADEVLRADLQAIRAAGIVPVFSAGNNGPWAASVGSPASYPEAIAVGATDDLDQVASFSSRGPSPWGEPKPEVVAPGVQIRSSLPGGTFEVHNGTSMAAPHVSGLAALVLQGDPTLTVDEIEAIITSTALPLGEETPNNDTGWGRIDAYRAAAVALQAGFVVGQVTRLPDQQPLYTAQITAYDHVGEPQATVHVDGSGGYQLALPPGRYNLEAKAFGYKPKTANDVSVQAALTTTLDIQLSPAPSGVLWGSITNAETGGPVSAQISIEGAPALTASDPQTGQYSMALPTGTYTVQVSQNGYRRSTSLDMEIVADAATRLDVALTPGPTLLLVDSGRWYYGSQASFFEQALNGRDYVYDLWEIRDLDADLPSLADLAGYEITIWSSPSDAPGLIGAGDVISNYLSTEGNLFLTGQDVGFWDGGLSFYTWHDYYGKFLKAEAVADNAGRNSMVGTPEELLDGLSLEMNGQDSAANQVSPDEIILIDPRNGSIIGQYAEDGEAALRASECQSYRAVYLAAGLEGLGDGATRAEVTDRALAWLGSPHPRVAVELYPPRQEQVWVTGTSITYTVELRNTGQSADHFDLELSPSAWPSSVWDGTFTQPMTQTIALSACQTQTLGLKVTVPPEVAWNVTDVVTLTARSQADTAYTAQTAFVTKAPAPILLVDDHRWYDTSDRYRSALEANHLPYDVWAKDPSTSLDAQSPSLQRLERYPIVIWFTAYDWHQTLTPAEEARLATRLDAGGRLLLSSQDYLYTSEFTDFARHYLGVASYTEGLTATQVTEAVSSPIGNGLGRYDLVYPFRNWSDSLRPSPEARAALWGQHAQPAALTLEQSPWKTAFFAFPLESLQEEDMATIVGRTVDWLSPLGDSSLTVDHPVAAQGDELAYTLSIRNTGPHLLNSVSLSNTVPTSTTYVDSSLQGPAHYDPLKHQFTWNGPLDAGQTITVHYRLQLDAALPDGAVIPNVAHLSDESGLAVDRLRTIRVNTPDLAFSGKTVSTQEATPGQILTYTLTLRNDGLRPAYAHLTDPLPLYTTYEPGSASASSGQLTATEGIVHWTGTITAGHLVTITLPVMISPSTAGLFVLNRAVLDDGWGDVQPLEAHTWVKAEIFLPLVLKQP